MYKFSSRIGTVDALSTIDSGVQAFEVDDSAAAKAVAVSIASDQQEGRIEIEVGIPWIDQCFSIGDRIKGASARDVQLNGRLAHGNGSRFGLGCRGQDVFVRREQGRN